MIILEAQKHSFEELLDVKTHGLNFTNLTTTADNIFSSV